ncbi:hypothetical protein ACEPAI_7531 [Sanghuangporus weigelae]
MPRVEGNEASAQSHTGEHLFRVLDEVLKTIGQIRFKRITSDNTGNTSLARVKTSQSLIISVRRSKIYRGRSPISAIPRPLPRN